MPLWQQPAQYQWEFLDSSPSTWQQEICWQVYTIMKAHTFGNLNYDYYAYILTKLDLWVSSLKHVQGHIYRLSWNLLHAWKMLSSRFWNYFLKPTGIIMLHTLRPWSWLKNAHTLRGKERNLHKQKARYLLSILLTLPFSLIHMNITWIDVMRCAPVRAAVNPSCMAKTLALERLANLSTKFFHTSIDFYHFILIPLTMILAGGHKVSAKQFLASCSCMLFGWSGWNLIGFEAIRAVHPDIIFQWDLVRQGK